MIMKEEFKSTLVRNEQLEHETRFLIRKNEEITEEITQLSKEFFELKETYSLQERKLNDATQKLVDGHDSITIFRIENDVLSDQIQAFHRALTEAQQKHDVLMNRNSELEKQVTELKKQNESLVKDLKRTTQEKMELEKSNEVLLKSTNQLLTEKNRLVIEMEERRIKSHNDTIAQFDEKELIRKERDKLEKKVRDITDDKDKLKGRLNKYRARYAGTIRWIGNFISGGKCLLMSRKPVKTVLRNTSKRKTSTGVVGRISPTTAVSYGGAAEKLDRKHVDVCLEDTSARKTRRTKKS
jgi:chromosome segregation ATPase